MWPPRADLLIERLALVGGKDAPLRTLSKGNAQKVALAQALLVPPRLLVLIGDHTATGPCPVGRHGGPAT